MSDKHWKSCSGPFWAECHADMEAQESRIRALEAACRVLGQELASWRNAPHRSEVLETYWADISYTDSTTIRFGLDVNNNEIASDAVRKGE